MIQASGILFLTPEKQALFLLRGNGSDHPLEWALPGGQREEGESLEECAVRECKEETKIGISASNLRPLARSIAKAEPFVEGKAPSEDVDYTTYVHSASTFVTPTLNYEHIGWAWCDVNHPPLPVHPGVALAIQRLTADELGVARMMVAGQLTSPQRYENVSLFNIRITGTGVAYRQALDEFVWRAPDVYMNDEFLARCNGLPVIMDHPEQAVLNSKEFASRVVGTVLLPYLVLEAGEVWAIAKIYDDEAIARMTNEPMSTSPSVVFRNPDVNNRLELEDGSKLLIEGKPSLLDHIAICKNGVWDKGQEPNGVINDSQEPAPSKGLDPQKLRELDHGLTLLNARLSNHVALAGR